MRKIVEEKGITLIALVITIIVLLILAGITINLTIGQDGIINMAQKAGKNYIDAEKAEQEELDKLYAQMLGGDLPENTKENPQDIGKIVKMPSNWETITPNYVSTTDGSIVTESTKISTVYAVSVGEGNTVPVPVGFYYVGGTLDTGVVISDKEEDSYLKNKKDMTGHADATKLVGNQFVWIPCSVSEYVKSNWANGSQGSISGKSNCYWGTEVNSLEIAEIKKYGGFYVSRYEAGLPIGTTEFTGSIAYDDDEYNFSGIPQSKAGISPWNFIDWNNSQKNAQKMYETKTNVESGLITGTQWDVMITKMAEKEGVSLTDSKEWGNYGTGEAFTYTGRAAKYDSTNNLLYAFGEQVTDKTKENSTRYLLSTGASDHNKAYNIYDVAGNLYEWTEESAASDSIKTLTTNRVLRGGSLSSASSSYPACFRYGSYTEEDTFYMIGFRVVLYMQ